MQRRILLGVCAALALGGCDKGEAAEAAGNAADEVAAAAEKVGETAQGAADTVADVVTAEAIPSEAELPLPADFEDEAKTSITAENYAAELDSIEKELEAEAG